MSDASTTVDVLLATHNGEPYVAEQIESVLAQTHEAIRLIVCDDCSHDATGTIVAAYAATDDRIRVLDNHRRFGSASANFLHLLHQSTADHVMLCDQDDVWLPHKVEDTLREMRRQESEVGPHVPVLVFTDMQVVDEDLAPIAASFERYTRIDPRRTAFRHVLAQSVGSGNTMMANRALVQLLAQTPEGQPMIMHDWWMSLVAAGLGRLAHLDETTLLYRQHATNANGALRYSVAQRLSMPADMHRRFALTVRQAQSFQEVYGPQLGTRDQATLRRYTRIADETLPARIADLCASGAWKLGLRKAGQVFGALMWHHYEATYHDKITRG